MKLQKSYKDYIISQEFCKKYIFVWMLQDSSKNLIFLN